MCKFAFVTLLLWTGLIIVVAVTLLELADSMMLKRQQFSFDNKYLSEF